MFKQTGRLLLRLTFGVERRFGVVASVVEWFVCSAAVREGTGSNPASDLV